MASCDPVKRIPRKRLNHFAYPVVLRWCGVASVLGGVLFVVWGYIDRPDIPENLAVVIQGWAFVVTTLFLAAAVGLCVLVGSRLGRLGWMGMVLAGYALVSTLVVSATNLVLSATNLVVRAIVETDAAWAHFLLRKWLQNPTPWLSLMHTGLTLMGIAIVRSGPSRWTGAAVLGTGLSGWVYNVTDSGAVLEARLVHIGFGLLFSLGWVALGVGLFAAGTSRAQKPQEPVG